MAERDDLFANLGKLLDAALYGRHDAPAYAEVIAGQVGLGECAGPEAAEKLLREALGLPPAPQCRCGITPGAPKDVVPYACQVHGTPCAGCGNFDGCPEDCDGAEYQSVDGNGDGHGQQWAVGILGADVAVAASGRLRLGGVARDQFLKAVALAETEIERAGLGTLRCAWCQTRLAVGEGVQCADPDECRDRQDQAEAGAGRVTP